MLSACQEKIDVSNTEGYELFLSQLKEGLKNTSHETAANHKVAKVSLSAFWRVLLFLFFVTSCMNRVLLCVHISCGIVTYYRFLICLLATPDSQNQCFSMWDVTWEDHVRWASEGKLKMLPHASSHKDDIFFFGQFLLAVHTKPEFFTLKQNLKSLSILFFFFVVICIDCFTNWDLTVLFVQIWGTDQIVKVTLIIFSLNSLKFSIHTKMQCNAILFFWAIFFHYS